MRHRQARIAVAVALAQKVGSGGHASFVVNLIAGLRRLGYEPMLLDRIEPGSCVDGQGRPCEPAASANAAWVRHVVELTGTRGGFSLELEGMERTLGMSRDEAAASLEAALVLDVAGFFAHRPIVDGAARRVFVDIDPGFPQMWREEGLVDLYGSHDAHVTIGLNMGADDCGIPGGDIDWITTPQPVVLGAWPARRPGGDAFTSVITWRGAYGPVERGGRTYGLRVHEFRKFVDLPRRSGRRFELALDIHPDEQRDLALLRDGGWSLVNPRGVAGDSESYRRYIQRSRGELMVAKNIYVDTHSGWFSDRSVCYLASGRPVLAQDTGWSRHFPTDGGLLAFSTLDDAVLGIEEIERDYERHCRAARGVAERYFDSDLVLRRLLDQLEVEPAMQMAAP